MGKSQCHTHSIYWQHSQLVHSPRIYINKNKIKNRCREVNYFCHVWVKCIAPLSNKPQNKGLTRRISESEHVESKVYSGSSGEKRCGMVTFPRQETTGLCSGSPNRTASVFMYLYTYTITRKPVHQPAPAAYSPLPLPPIPCTTSATSRLLHTNALHTLFILPVSFLSPHFSGSIYSGISRLDF